MQGVCTDPGSTTVLQEGEKYFLFDHGERNYYVSKFDNEKAHFGSYRKSLFEVVEDQQEMVDIPTGLSHAAVVEEYKGYSLDAGEIVVIGPTRRNKGTHVYFYGENMRFRGCMPARLFKILRPYEGEIPKPHQMPQIEPKEETATIPLPDEKEPENDKGVKVQSVKITKVWIKKEKPKKEKVKKEKKSVPDGQLNIFDFMEG